MTANISYGLSFDVVIKQEKTTQINCDYNLFSRDKMDIFSKILQVCLKTK